MAAVVGLLLSMCLVVQCTSTSCKSLLWLWLWLREGDTDTISGLPASLGDLCGERIGIWLGWTIHRCPPFASSSSAISNSTVHLSIASKSLSKFSRNECAPLDAELAREATYTFMAPPLHSSSRSCCSRKEVLSSWLVGICPSVPVPNVSLSREDDDVALLLGTMLPLLKKSMSPSSSSSSSRSSPTKTSKLLVEDAAILSARALLNAPDPSRKVFPFELTSRLGMLQSSWL